MVYKIVRGNSFWLHVVAQKQELSKDFKALVPCDFSVAEDIQVELTDGMESLCRLKHEVAGVWNNELVCKIPSDLELGCYGIRVTCTIDGIPTVSAERKLLNVVSNNAQSRVPMGVVEGASTGFLNFRYYIATENITVCPITYSVDDVKLSSQPTAVKNGERLQLTLTPEDGFSLGLVKVIMAGDDVTNAVYKSGVVDIPAVSGWVTIMANGDQQQYYYGASAASEICQLDINTLTRADDNIVGKSITIATTDEADRAWIVSRVPVVLMQAGFELEMNQQKLGDLYYYWSDPLVAADDNVYVIKIKE